MDYKILEDLNKKRFNSPEVLRLIIFRALKIVLFCLSLTFLLWFFLIQNYLLFTVLLGIFFGMIAEILINSRKSSLKSTAPNKESYFTEKKIEEENKVEL
jgi:predicted membrane protein